MKFERSKYLTAALRKFARPGPVDRNAWKLIVRLTEPGGLGRQLR